MTGKKLVQSAFQFIGFKLLPGTICFPGQEPNGRLGHPIIIISVEIDDIDDKIHVTWTYMDFTQFPPSRWSINEHTKLFRWSLIAQPS